MTRLALPCEVFEADDWFGGPEIEGQHGGRGYIIAAERENTLSLGLRGRHPSPVPGDRSTPGESRPRRLGWDGSRRARGRPRIPRTQGGSVSSRHDDPEAVIVVVVWSTFVVILFVCAILRKAGII
jgi:hypothetical protein